MSDNSDKTIATTIADSDNHDKVSDGKNASVQASTPTATLAELFSTAEPLDYLLMFVGTIGGLISGISLPFFNVLFGQMLDALNSGNAFSW